MLKNGLYILAISLTLACNNTPKPKIEMPNWDCNRPEVIADTLGTRFMASDSCWSSCLDPQLTKYYQDFNLMTFEGIKDTIIPNRWRTDDERINQRGFLYTSKKIDSTHISVVAVSRSIFCDYEVACADYYPTLFTKENGIWKGKGSNTFNTHLRQPSIDDEKEAYFLIEERKRVYYFYKYRGTPDEKGVLFINTDSTLTGFKSINIASILKHDTRRQVKACQQIMNSRKPFIQANYIRAKGLIVGIDGLLNNKPYHLDGKFPILSNLQGLMHYGYSVLFDIDR